MLMQTFNDLDMHWLPNRPDSSDIMLLFELLSNEDGYEAVAQGNIKCTMQFVC